MHDILIFDLNKSRRRKRTSRKGPFKSSKIQKFGLKMLYCAENIALQSLRIFLVLVVCNGVNVEFYVPVLDRCVAVIQALEYRQKWCTSLLIARHLGKKSRDCKQAILPRSQIPTTLRDFLTKF